MFFSRKFATKWNFNILKQRSKPFEKSFKTFLKKVLTSKKKCETLDSHQAKGIENHKGKALARHVSGEKKKERGERFLWSL